MINSTILSYSHHVRHETLRPSSSLNFTFKTTCLLMNPRLDFTSSGELFVLSLIMAEALRNLFCDPGLGVRILQILTSSTAKLSKEPKMSIL